MSWEGEGDTGYICNVDLDYPTSLHDNSAHFEFPLAPEKIAIPKNHLSQYQQNLLKTLKTSYNSTTKKLIPHLGNRTGYVVHYKNLQYYLKKGMILKKVHDIIAFDQRQWLKPFILKNTLLRQKAKSKFEQDLFKLINNSIFGKSMQQMRNRMNVKITDNPTSILKHTKKPNHKTFEIVHKKLAILFSSKPTVLLDRPLYTAFSVLDLSKLYMYEWHYDKIKEWYGNNANLLYTDTDSLIYQIYTDNLFEDLKCHEEDFDFGDYDSKSEINGFLSSPKNKKVLGKMKDEAHGKILFSFIGLAPKMYSIVGEHNYKVTKAKGVKRALVKKALTHEFFRKSLFKQRVYECKMNLMRSKNHKLFVANFKKRAIHNFESKRYILDGGVRSRPHYHFKNEATSLK